MNSHERELIVMTQNVYLGANLGPILVAKSPAELIDAVATAWSQVQATIIPERAEKIAQEIAAAQPDLVGLQEVVQWSCGTSDATHVKYDFLELILMSLRKHGSPYVPLAIKNNLDQTAPLNTNGELVRLVDRHAVLLRVNPPFPQIQPYNAHAATFSSLLPLSNWETGSASIPRSWIAVDAILNGGKFRFIETHLESFDGDVQAAQALELIGGPAATDLPVIMVGDYNSNANREPSLPDYTATYTKLIAAGFQDTWAAINPNDLGNTGVQAADLRNPASSLDRRIDLILTRGGTTPISVELVGLTVAPFTPSGLWPSDHVGVRATLRISRVSH